MHPDRNRGNTEEATKLFAAVQSAYEILSDPQERVWYDTHRDAVLRDKHDVSAEHYDHDIRITTAEDILQMFTQLQGSLDFTDSGTGFYSVLRKTFDTLAREEELASEWEGSSPFVYPSLGHAEDNFEDVVKPFYTVWSGFATRKSFSWQDIYHYSEAPDRRVRRTMEKENKRFRDEAIREFNHAVRSLVAFVKKRDPRFRTNTQTENERQQILRDAAAAQAARSRAANRAKCDQPEPLPKWTNSDEIDECVSSDDVGETIQELVECVVCNKSFKTENQYETHAKSKKHLKATQRLRHQMRQENIMLDLDEKD